MTKFEEVKRPANGPLTELNNNMQEVFSQYRKMRQYADYLEYELKQKDEHILKVENENSFMRDERTTFDSNGNSVEPIIPQQALPVVPEFVAKWYEEHKDDLESSIYRLCIEFNQKVVNTLKTKTKLENWLDYRENKPIETLIRMQEGYTVEKPQLFYLKATDSRGHEYLNLDTSEKSIFLSGKKQYDEFQTKFTLEEIKGNSLLKPFIDKIVPVEDGE